MHLFSAYDTFVVSGGELSGSGVWVQSVHVADGASRQHHVVVGLLEAPATVYCEIFKIISYYVVVILLGKNFTLLTIRLVDA